METYISNALCSFQNTSNVSSQEPYQIRRRQSKMFNSMGFAVQLLGLSSQLITVATYPQASLLTSQSLCFHILVIGIMVKLTSEFLWDSKERRHGKSLVQSQIHSIYLPINFILVLKGALRVSRPPSIIPVNRQLWFRVVSNVLLWKLVFPVRWSEVIRMVWWTPCIYNAE